MGGLNTLNEQLYGHSDPLAEIAGDVDPGDRSVTKEFSIHGEDTTTDPVGTMFQKAADDMLAKTAGVELRWDELVAPLKKRESLPATGTLAKRLGITRVEEILIAGEKWMHGFNAAGELVDARIIG